MEGAEKGMVKVDGGMAVALGWERDL